jgi:hypothetical protein
MKTLAIILIYLIGLNSSSTTSNAQNFDGTWSSIIVTAEGQTEVVYQLETDGNDLTGTAFLPTGVYPLEQGSVNGNTISFVIMYGNISLYHTGYYLRDQLLLSTSYEGGSGGQLTLNRVSDNRVTD